MELLVLSFLHKNLKMFNAGIILTFVTAFPGGLVLPFWLEIIFSLVKGAVLLIFYSENNNQTAKNALLLL